MYVYIQSEPGLWTVGFYKPDGTWEPESDHSSRDQAANRVHYLNGGKALERQELQDAVEVLIENAETERQVEPKLAEPDCPWLRPYIPGSEAEAQAIDGLDPMLDDEV